MKSTKAFHFSGSNLAFNLAGIRVEPGLQVELDPNVSLVLCEWGLHGSKRITDALRYAKGLILSRTEHSGEITQGDDKLCSRIRTHASVIDATKPVVAWAQWCARRAKKHAAANATAARSAAADAAYAATCAAYAAATYDAAASAATRSATYEAATCAADAATCAAARAAARGHSTCYGYDAASAADAERNLQERVLVAYAKHAGLKL